LAGAGVALELRDVDVGLRAAEDDGPGTAGAATDGDVVDGLQGVEGRLDGSGSSVVVKRGGGLTQEGQAELAGGGVVERVFSGLSKAEILHGCLFPFRKHLSSLLWIASERLTQPLGSV